MTRHPRDRVRHRTWLRGAAAGIALAAAAWAVPAAAQETFRIGIITFLSGPAAESFGVPAWNGGKVLVEALNKGEGPAPYDKVGFGGMRIEPVVVDENGGATKQVQELRNLFQRENVDVAVGYVSSGDCLAVAPAAEELKRLLILYDCGTPRIFEERQYQYVFRTASHGAMDNVALARYLKTRNVKADTISLINQDYAWGHDSRTDFVLAMQQLYPGHKVESDLLPAFGSGQYGTEISALLRSGSQIVHSSLWGGDLQAFILQAGPRGLFRRSQVVLSAADHVLPPLGDKVPDGIILGGRGAYGLMSPDTPLNQWFWSIYQAQHTVYPVQAPYRMAQALLGLKLAVEKAMAENGGRKPNNEQIAAALRGSEWEAPGGRIRMALGNGHQAVQPTAIGRTRYDPQRRMVVLDDIQRFDAECVNPPPNMTSQDWIKAGFPGAKCE
ncbi:MAG TPA: ABC transporter substrate-binding protein [Azospirillaceae bacterium]|nr:ABC transporter substrate-binding protein [Azospirillaceae bacterium]